MISPNSRSLKVKVKTHLSDKFINNKKDIIVKHI